MEFIIYVLFGIVVGLWVVWRITVAETKITPRGYADPVLGTGWQIILPIVVLTWPLVLIYFGIRRLVKGRKNR